MNQETLLSLNESGDKAVNLLTSNSVTDSSVADVPDQSNSSLVFASSTERHECPISGEPIRVPIITNNGFTYDFVSIAEWLCTGADTDPASGDGIITALILNRAIRDNAVILNQEEKRTIAKYYVQLEKCHPEIDIDTINTIEGIHDLIDELQQPDHESISHAMPMQREIPWSWEGEDILLIVPLVFIVLIMIQKFDSYLAKSDTNILMNLFRKLGLSSSRNMAIQRFESRCSSEYPTFQELNPVIYRRDNYLYSDILNIENNLTNLLDRHTSLRNLKGLDRASISSLVDFHKHLNESSFLLKNSLNYRPRLTFATQLGKVDFIRNLLNLGYAVDQANACGQTALMMAAALGDMEIMDILLEGNANPNAQDKSGLTALHVAGFTGQTGAFKRLLRAGANPETRDALAMTADMYAVESKQTIFLFQNIRLPGTTLSRIKTDLFQRIKSQATSEVKLHPVMLNSTLSIFKSGFFRPNQPVCRQALKNGESRVVPFDELTTTERKNTNTKCGYPVSPTY